MRGVVFASLGVVLSGCFSFDFAARGDIEYTRVIGLQLDPPVIRSGDQVTVRPLVVRPDGSHVSPDGEPFTDAEGNRACDGEVCFDWAFCFRPERTPGLESAQYSPERPSEGCESADLATGLGANPFLRPNPDGSLTIDSTPIGGMLDSGMLEGVATALGLPRAVVDRILEEVGLTFVIELRVFDGDEVFVGFKRGLFVNDACTGAECGGLNPPPPQLEIYREGDRGDVRWVTGRGVSEPFRCRRCDRAPATGACALADEGPVVLTAGTRYIVAPEEDGEEWLEDYTILTVTGDFIPAREAGFFSFFANGGSLDQEKTRFPAAEEVWTTPAEPGDYALWVVARDGHFGQDACRVDVRIQN